MKSSAGKDSFGLQVIADVLYHAVLLYDAIIFCLNILANVVESGCSRIVFVDMMILTVVKASSKSRTVRFLAWLTRWLENPFIHHHHHESTRVFLCRE
jgi:hypothetical protein